MRRADLRSIISDLADRVASPLLLEDARQRTVAYSPQYQAVDELRKEAILTGSLTPEIIAWSESFGIRTATAPVRTPPDQARGILARVCVPVRHAGILLGYIWAIDPDDRLGPDELAVLTEEAADIAALLYREQLAADLGGELLRGLLSSSARVRAGYANDPGLAEVLPANAKATIVVGRDVDPADVEIVLRQRSAWTLYTVTTDEVVVLVPTGAGAAGPARAVGEAIAARAPSAVVGISEAHATHAALHLAYREAADAARVGRAVPGLGRVLEWARLGAYRLLVRAALAGLPPVGLQPLRRTICTFPVPDSLGQTRWPMMVDADERFYLKPEPGHFLASPADETPSEPMDPRPDMLDIAIALERVRETTTLDPRTVSSSWAGLRTFAPDRRLVLGRDPLEPSFVWCAGQGGFGIQSSPAAARAVVSLVDRGELPPDVTALGGEAAAITPDRFRA